MRIRGYMGDRRACDGFCVVVWDKRRSMDVTAGHSTMLRKMPNVKSAVGGSACVATGEEFDGLEIEV